MSNDTKHTKEIAEAIRLLSKADLTRDQDVAVGIIVQRIDDLQRQIPANTHEIACWCPTSVHVDNCPYSEKMVRYYHDRMLCSENERAALQRQNARLIKSMVCAVSCIDDDKIDSAAVVLEAALEPHKSLAAGEKV